MKELGEYLRRARIDNGVSITEACEDLELSTSHLENIESGNIRAFKDVYELRDYVKNYAKYLGLDTEKILDEFNGFLFEHTSKISLNDIKSFHKNNEEDRKIQSPYTKEYKEKFNFLPFVYYFIVIILILVLLYLFFVHIQKEPKRVDELKGYEEARLL